MPLNKKMNNETNRLIPDLRFPEFVNEGEWEDTTLDAVATILKGKGISKSDIAQNGSLPCIRYGELYTHYSETIRAIKSYTNLKGEDLVLSQANDVIIPASGETQIDIATASCVLENGIALGSDLNIIRTKVDGVFLSYYLNNAKKKDIAQLAQGISVVHLYPNQLKTLALNIPKPHEQQKIASCLSSLDEVIAAHSQKLEALKEYKKGLMQNLFPQEGETVPKKRFSEFLKDGSWVEKNVGKFIRISSGKGFKASEYSNKGVRLLQIENVSYGKIIWNGNTVYLPENYVNDHPDLLLKKGDLVLALNRPVTNNELKIARLKEDDEPSILYQRVGKIELLSVSLDKEFIFQVCRAFIKNFVLRKSIGSDQPFISLKELYAQKVAIPALPEQQKIASCLSLVDDLITAEVEKIWQLKLHKRGLMQGLFPKVIE